MNVNDDILWFDIPMDDFLFVAFSYSVQNIAQDKFFFINSQGPLHPNKTHQILPIDIVHEDDILIISLVETLELAEMGIVLQRKKIISFFNHHFGNIIIVIFFVSNFSSVNISILLVLYFENLCCLLLNTLEKFPSPKP